MNFASSSAGRLASALQTWLSRCRERCFASVMHEHADSWRQWMGSNSTQGVATLLFLAGFTCLSGALFAGGSVLLIVAFLVLTGGSIGLFLKAKPWEHATK
jgi:hypothetical protein